MQGLRYAPNFTAQLFFELQDGDPQTFYELVEAYVVKYSHTLRQDTAVAKQILDKVGIPTHQTTLKALVDLMPKLVGDLHAAMEAGLDYIAEFEALILVLHFITFSINKAIADGIMAGEKAEKAVSLIDDTGRLLTDAAYRHLVLYCLGEKKAAEEAGEATDGPTTKE
jgi:hypothetical protein